MRAHLIRLAVVVLNVPFVLVEGWLTARSRLIDRSRHRMFPHDMYPGRVGFEVF